MTEIDDRLDRLESLVERQQERIDDQQDTIDAQRDRIDELEGNTDTTADSTPAPRVSRRGALTAGGLLALLFGGVGTASADAQGQVGTSGDPLSVLYTRTIAADSGNGLTFDTNGSTRTLHLGSPSVTEQFSATETIAGNVIAGHPDNTVNNDASGVVLGGGGYRITGSTDEDKTNTVGANFATLGGGINNTASGKSSVITGGVNNTAGGESSVVAGGEGNTAPRAEATVGGGLDNEAGDYYATVAGGNNNTASGSAAAVGGGDSNNASGRNSTIGGGNNNTAEKNEATVSGGDTNTASKSAATVGGGDRNTASGNRATVGGGQENTASGAYGTIPGGWNNTVTERFSMAAGRYAAAEDTESFVWNDGSGENGIADSKSDRFSSSTVVGPTPSGEQTFSVKATGGVRFITDRDNSAYAYVTTGGDFKASGTKDFVETVATPTGEQTVTYTALEAPTARTEVSGIAEVENGVAEVSLPDHFEWVTDPTEEIIVQVTAHTTESVDPRVTERSTERIRIEGVEDAPDSYEVSYTVKGTRAGYADKTVVAERDDGEQATEERGIADD